MKTFIKELVVFSVFFLVFFFTSYYLYFFFKNFKIDKDALYIWGDSQTYEGINLKLLKDTTKKQVYSSSAHGSGVYDFLIFSKMAPKNATVIVTLSKPVQIREKNRDRNDSGILLTELFKLIQSNYSVQEVYGVVKKSKKPIKLFKTNSKRYTDFFTDSTQLNIQKEAFKNYYKTIPNYIYDKQDIYTEGFKTLISKKCKIIILEFPYHPKLESIEKNSSLKKETDSFKANLIDLISDLKTDSILIKEPKQMMRDITHLNRMGSDYVTKNISRIIYNNDRNYFIEIKNID